MRTHIATQPADQSFESPTSSCYSDREPSTCIFGTTDGRTKSGTWSVGRQGRFKGPRTAVAVH